MTDELNNDVVVDDAAAAEGGEGYTEDELRIIRDFHGVNDDTAGDEEGASEVVADVSTDSGESDDPWAWAKDYEPEKVRKTWEKFTEEWQKVAEMESQYKPFMELANEIQGNPALAAHIKAFFENEQGQTDNAIMTMKSELEEMRREIGIKEEMAELKTYISTEKLPEVDERKVLEYAAKNNSPSLQSAYRDMMFDEIRSRSREETLEEVRRTKGAAVPKIGNGTKVKTGITQAEIDNMSDEELVERYAEVQEFYAKNG